MEPHSNRHQKLINILNVLLFNTICIIIYYFIFCNILFKFFLIFQYTEKYTDKECFGLTIDKPLCLTFFAGRCWHRPLHLWLSPRYISIGQLNTLLYLHLQPINQLVFLVSYHLNSVGYLILGWASHLDAFSVYPFHT